MNKIFFQILLVMSFMTNLSAGASTDKPTEETKDIDIEFSVNDIDSKFHRAPLHLNLKIVYDFITNTVKIDYEGEATGDVFIYKNNVLVGYDSEINTSIMLPSNKGKYEIEIITDSWIAKGYLEL